jgi:ElaA protein
MQYKKTIQHFSELNTETLYEIMRVRQEVFVVEQNCPYLDADGKDQYAYHLLLCNDEGKIMAYTRLLAEGVSYPGYISIGRVLSVQEFRGCGAGRAVMAESIKTCMEIFGRHYPIKIGAQSYLKDFYRSFGFEVSGEEYLEDGIPHLHMIRQWL